MPNKNGTGPEGKGPKTGRGLGSCCEGNPKGGGQGRGFGAGAGLRRNVKKENEGKVKDD